MIRFSRKACILAAGVLLVVGIGRAWGITVEQVYRVLGERGIPFDHETCERAAVAGVLKAADHGARILSVDELGTPATNKTLETAEEWAEGICYVKLNGLYEGGGAESVRLLRAWAKVGQTGMIVDIRGASGGDLESVDHIGGMFNGTNTLLYTVRNGRGQVLESHRVKDWTPLEDTPLMVLVDGDTAGACELLAATLKGRRGVMLVGRRTKGDARLRENIRLGDDEVLYIATRWLVPADETEYDQVGIRPDVVIAESGTARAPGPVVKRIGKRPSEKARVDRKLMERVAGDPALARATDILLGLKALGRTGK